MNATEPTMRQNLRLQAILDYLQDHAELTVDQACTLLKASPATIRRDFNMLNEHGEVSKTWGGVARKQQMLSDMKPLFLRQTHFVKEKKAIARAAASMIKDGDVVMIDGGTTTLEMTPLLLKKKIRVITNSLLIANKLHLLQKGWQGAELFMTGGFLYPDSGLLVGPEANKTILAYHADWAFLSCGGVDKTGVTNSNQLVVETERNMIQQSNRAIVLADYSKFGNRSMSKICEFSELDMVISNTQLESEILDDIRAADVAVKLV